MGIDERLEALTQTVELLAAMHKDTAKAQQDHIAEQRKRDIQIDQLHSEMMLAMARLANIAQFHNGQLEDHKRRIEGLESQ